MKYVEILHIPFQIFNLFYTDLNRIY